MPSSLPVREKLREWIRLPYAYFDAQPQAFTYVLLTDGVVPQMERRTMTKQGRLLMELIRQAQTNGEVRRISPEVAVSHFTGLLLNVPRLINEGTLEGPASQYVDEVAEAGWRVLASNP